MTRPRQTPILCPECSQAMTTVTQTRVVQGALRRRRQCPAGHRIWTKEVPILPGGVKPD